MWHLLRSTLQDQLNDVDCSKTPTWLSHGSCTADEELAWPEFGCDALTFLDNHRQVLQSTLAPQHLVHKLNIFDDDDETGTLTREWQIHGELWSRIYRTVDFAAEALGLDMSCFSAGQEHARHPQIAKRFSMLPAGSKSRNVVCKSAACCGLNMAVVAAAGSTRNKSQVDLQAWMVEAGIKYSIKVVHEGPLQGALPAFIAHSVCLGPGLFRSSVQCAPSQLLM